MDKKTKDLMFSSDNTEWETPRWLIRLCEQLIGGKFTLDACAKDRKAAKAPKYISPAQDALKPDLLWHGRVWMNPPYGRRIQHWIKKAYEQSLAGATVVCLLPARVDTRWFHKYCIKGDVKLVKGRLFFEVDGKPILDPKTGRPMPAPFPSMLVFFTAGRKKRSIEAIEVHAS